MVVLDEVVVLCFVYFVPFFVFPWMVTKVRLKVAIGFSLIDGIFINIYHSFRLLRDKTLQSRYETTTILGHHLAIIFNTSTTLLILELMNNYEIEIMKTSILFS